MECCRIRVKDVDFARNQIVIRQGKGDKDRPVMLPQAVREELARILSWREQLPERDLARKRGWVCLPDAFAVKDPGAPWELGWQFLFASRQLSQEPRSGKTGRHGPEA